MSSITVRIPDSLEHDLNVVAKFQDRPKSRIIKQALENYVTEAIEDAEDIVLADQALAASTGETISLQDMIKELGLEDEMEDWTWNEG